MVDYLFGSSPYFLYLCSLIIQIIKTMKVIKRDGSKQEFDWLKIYKAIKSAFNSCGEQLYDDDYEDIIAEIYLYDKDGKELEEISVEDLQDQIEEALFECGFFQVAKSYILYREKHKDLRFIKERSDYIDRCSESNDNTATVSEVDANANVQSKNVATIESEVYKTLNKQIQRYKMKKKLQQMYPEVANQYEIDLENHIIYQHDEASSSVPKPYCVAVSMYPFLLHGTSTLDGLKSQAPKNLTSFCGQFNNLIFLLSSQFKGAVACLYKDQSLIINGRQISIKDFVESKWSNPEKNGDWEFCRLDGKDLINEDGSQVSVLKIFKRKYSSKIYRIKSNKGLEAKVSEDHKFKVLRKGKIEEIPAKELELFDTVFVNNDIPFDCTSEDYQKGWIKGMLLGDGCLTQNPSVSLSVNYDQKIFGDIFNQYSEAQYGNTLSLCSGHKCFNYQRRNQEYYDNLTKDLVGTNTFDKHLEQNPVNYSINFLIGILDGLLCADGCDNHSVILSLTNKLLINDVKYILNILRIPYTYKEISAHDNKNTLYHLTISSSVIRYTRNFLRKIRGNKKWNETYYFSGKARKSGRKDPNYIMPTTKDHFLYPDYKLDVITSIETFDNDDDYVYEIETSSHWYNCGGFITHNCGEFFNVFYYYCVKEFGEKFWLRESEIAHCASVNSKTISDIIEQAFQNIVYSINQPAGNRSYQSPFVNISYYDRNYWHALFDEFVFPDGTQPEWEGVSYLQKKFMRWFNKERTKTLLTFPVN